MKTYLPLPAWSRIFSKNSTKFINTESKGFVFVLDERKSQSDKQGAKLDRNNPSPELRAGVQAEAIRLKSSSRSLRKNSLKLKVKSSDSLKDSSFGGSPVDGDSYSGIVRIHAPDWQVEELLQSKKELLYFIGKQGPVWILRKFSTEKAPGTEGARVDGAGHYGLLRETNFTWARDLAGSLVSHFKIHQVKQVEIEFIGTSEAYEEGFLVGLNMAAYNYKQCLEGKYLADLPKTHFLRNQKPWSEDQFKQGSLISEAINLARHLINMPPNELHPLSFAHLLERGLTWPRGQTKISIWQGDKLKRENMNLLLAVGGGGLSGPCMVHLRYRPKIKSKRPPIAFVGKGITFDSGGLDIKPPSGMRLMKKDMGGAATLAGLAYWVVHSDYPHPCDFYFALAENSLDSKAMRPGDVYKSRSGQTIEIDNTDAEGRLVLADVLDVAVTAHGADEPETVINVATLTGAIKVALGADLAGLFSNDDRLADRILLSGVDFGDPCWRMPLVDRYLSGLTSSFADFKNSTEGFGGAITAALFLQRFVRNKKWAHLDIYSWNDKALGPFSFAGGSGQGVACLIGFLRATAQAESI